MTYTALAIGPIYKTMSYARKTRHLWGASYLFSYIMKQIIKKLLNKELINESGILLPHSTASLRDGKEHYGTGLFPDRLFIMDEKGKVSEDELKTIEQDILKELTDKAGGNLKDYFNNYFRIYSVSYNLPDISLKLFDEDEKNKNIVLVGNKLLDSLEIKEKYYNNISDTDWKNILDDLNGKSFLYKDAFGQVKEDYQFPYLIEIATDDFRQRNEDRYDEIVNTCLRNSDEDEESQDKFLTALKDATKEKPSPFGNVQLKAYHKYIAVVQADGDNIGATIGKIGNEPDRIKQFSKALGKFAIEATKAIKYYGGKSVYVGGDDLLFFAPAAVNTNENSLKTIFDLTANLDYLFKKYLLEDENLNKIYLEKDEKEDFKVPKPSLSYGISITYSKFPLNEARDSAYHLMKEAKEAKAYKNKICFKILKHSGQGLGFTIDKKRYSGDWNKPLSFDRFLSVTTNIPLEKNLLSSVIYKIHPIRDLINKVAEDKKRLEALFENTFNETIHKKQEVHDYLQRVQLFINQLYIDFPSDIDSLPDYETKQRKSNLQKIYSTLRFVKFVTDDIND